MFFIDSAYNNITRYDMARFMDFGANCHDVITSYIINKIKSLQVFGYTTVQGEEENPALLSYKIYRNTQFWWLLLIYNDLSDLDELTSGMTIKYPSIDSIENLYFNLKAQERSQAMSYIPPQRSEVTINYVHVNVTGILVMNEIPSGLIDSNNKIFTLVYTPISGSEKLYLNGILQTSGISNDYVISGNQITFNSAPDTGDILKATYVREAT